jgi:hypothetical protein
LSQFWRWPDEPDLGLATMKFELERANTYVWMGAFDRSGTLVGAHRAMLWGSHLLLKGLTVASSHLGSTAALALATSLRNHANEIGLSGLAVWIEPSKSERRIADRLGLVAQGPRVHRYQFPLDNPPCPDMSAIAGGLLAWEFDGTPMVRDLLGTRGGVCWVLDRGRVVLSGTPCASIDEARRFAQAVGARVGCVRASSVEFTLLAADLDAAIRALAAGGRRLSRTPVRLGLPRGLN